MKDKEEVPATFIAKVASISDDFLEKNIESIYKQYGNVRPIGIGAMIIVLCRAVIKEIGIEDISDNMFSIIYKKVESFLEKSSIVVRSPDGFLLVESPINIIGKV